MGTGDRKIEGDISRNEESKNPIEDNRQLMDEPPSESTLNYNYKPLNDIMNKKFREDFQDFEPHDLSKIRGIVDKAKKESIKQKKPDTKIKYLSNALDKVRNIIDNYNNVYEILLQEGRIPDPEDNRERQDELNKANNLLRQLESLLNDLQLEKDDGAYTPPEPNIKEINTVKTSIQETKISNDYMTVEEVAQYINYSESHIYHNKDEIKIPYHRKSERGQLNFIKQEIDEWMRNDKPKMETVDKPEPLLQEDKKSENKRHFIFKERPLEMLTDAFIKGEYLVPDNADLMKDRFSILPKQTDKPIFWDGKLKSLVTFVYLSDRLGFIDKDKTKSSNFRVHDASDKEKREEEEEKMGNKEVQFINLLHNFIIPKEYGFSESEFTREWKEINEAIITLRKAILRRNNPEKSEDDYVEDMTRREAILHYFSNKDKKTFKIDTKIDKKILDIFYDTWINSKNNFIAS